MSSEASDDKLSELEEEVVSLRGAIWLLHRIANLVRATPEVEPTCYAVLVGVTAYVGLGMDRAMLFLADPARRTALRGAAAIGADGAAEAGAIRAAIEAEAPDLEALYEAGLKRRASRAPLDVRVRAVEIDAGGRTPPALALRRGAAVVGEGEDDAGGLFDLRTSIAAPVRGKAAVIGALYADNRWTGRPIEPVDTLVLTMLADHAGRAIESAQQFERLAREARTDALTGLPHHGVLMADVARLVEAATAAGEPLGFAMIDLDDFKRVNDQLGHPAGDAMLSGVAARLREVVRGREGVYRYGGEEFAMLIPGADRAASALVGERLRHAVSSRPFELGAHGARRITCSVGVASLPDDARDGPGLVEAADAALRRAKARGKDRVERAWDRAG
ncbi:MAG: sensor domain-containing diguanylate cyclase [Polyangiaceae bacterium]|nr:sensor domain-containing diguanylate cyclase [Polyangiaceae bacterium]